MNNEFMQGLDQYIQINYNAYSYAEISDGIVCEKSAVYIDTPRQKELTKNQSADLQHILKEVGDSFRDRLFELIDRSGMTDVEIYKRAGIDRRLFSKIRSNPSYHPGKNTVLALAIALELDINETKDLLARTEYAFSPASKGDLIVKYFIEHQVYDLRALNFALDEYDQPILG